MFLLINHPSFLPFHKYLLTSYYVPGTLISAGYMEMKKMDKVDFPGGAVVKNLPANAGDTGSSPGPGRSHMPRGN